MFRCIEKKTGPCRIGVTIKSQMRLSLLPCYPCEQRQRRNGAH